MSDHELLEMAAKAVGIKKSSLDNGEPFYIGVATDHAWNPLIYDGDAFRLSVALKLDICFYNGYQEVGIQGDWEPEPVEASESYGSDIPTATRRAIVRAAAQIGRRMS